MFILDALSFLWRRCFPAIILNQEIFMKLLKPRFMTTTWGIKYFRKLTKFKVISTGTAELQEICRSVKSTHHSWRFRNRHRRFSKKSYSKKFCKIHRKHLCQSRVSFLINLHASACNFIKNQTLAQLFSYEFCEICKNTFFTKHHFNMLRVNHDFKLTITIKVWNRRRYNSFSFVRFLFISVNFSIYILMIS